MASGRSRGGAQGPIFWVKKEEMAEGRKAGSPNKTKPGPSLAHGLDLPLTAMTSWPPGQSLAQLKGMITCYFSFLLPLNGTC